MLQRLVGGFMRSILQEASDHVPQVSDQFIAYTGDTDLAILLNRDTSPTLQSLLFTRLRQARTRGAWQFLWFEDCCEALPFLAPPPSRFVLCTFTVLWSKKRDAPHPGAQLFAYLDDWYLWIKPHCLLQTIAVITAATSSVNLALQTTKTQIWKGSCQDPIPLEFQDKVTLTLSCLGGHLQIHGDTDPSQVVLGEQATMEKTTQRFQKIKVSMCRL